MLKKLSKFSGGKSVQDKILSLEKGAMERWRNGDPWGWIEISAEDITYFDQNLVKPIIGLDAYKTYLKQCEGQIYYQGSEFLNPKIVQIGNTAVLTYNYRSTDTNPASGQVNQLLWNTTEVYSLIENEWKIIHRHWSFVNHKLPIRVEIPLPVQTTPTEFEGVLDELMALESAAMERWRKGDPWGFIELFGQEITYFDSATPQRINGLDAMRAELKQLEGKIHYDVMEFIEPHVQVLGDTAVLTYRFLSTQLNPDGSIFCRTPWNCSEIYARLNGKWRIIHNHWSFIKGELS
jgi:ketosteroid isomerase-like protein